MSVLTHYIVDEVATIVLDNPPQNRFAPEFTQELSDIVDTITRSSARAVVLRAEGPDFSYGRDFQPWVEADRTNLRADFDHALAVINRFEQLPIPVVAAVQGCVSVAGSNSRCGPTPSWPPKVPDSAIPSSRLASSRSSAGSTALPNGPAGPGRSNGR